MSRLSPPRIDLFYNRAHFLSRQAVRGILRYARAFGPWFITLNDWDATPSPPTNCRGILVCSPRPELIRGVARFKTPIVFVNFTDFLDGKAYTFPHVRSNSREFGIQAAEFFLSKTFRTFVYVPDAIDWRPWNLERGEAFAERIRQAGHDVHLYVRAKTPLPPQRELTRLAKWLRKLPRPLSIFAANDARARQVLDACLLANISVPHEAMILGVDNDELLCETAHPSLSSIPFNAEESGFESAQILDDLMRQHQSNPGRPLPTPV